MTSSLVAWSIAALLLFWAVGAYNRLMRLRAEVMACFVAVQAQLLEQAQLAGAFTPDGGAPGAAPSPVPEPGFLAQIQAASAQLAACLDPSRPRALDHERVAALASAAQVLQRAWERAEREDVHDLAGPQLPDTLTENRARLVRETQAAVALFDEAVGRYNAAIAEFPAFLLAWVFGFKPGRLF